MRNLLATAAVVIAWTIPGAALAQDKSAQPPVTAGEATTVPSGETPQGSSDVGAAAGSATGLGEIIVTAQRKTENAQRAAIAIDVVGGADLIASGVNSSAQLGTLVPALNVQQIGQSSVAFIRGVGNFSVAVASDPAVAFNLDGVYIGRQTATQGAFYDLDRVEVLKGPQGTLYGRNATGGAINVLPTQPKIGKFAGYATASYGNYNALTAEGAINIPVGTNSAFRFSGTLTDRDGYLSDGTSDSKTQGVRAQFKSNLTPDLTVRLSGDYNHIGGNGQGFTPINTHRLNLITGGFTVTPTNIPRSDGPTSPSSDAFYTSLPTGGLTLPFGIPAGVRGRNRNAFPDLFQNSNFYGVHADIVLDTGAGILTLIPAYRWDHVRNLSGAGGFAFANDQKDQQSSLEARFAGKVALFDYTIGGFLFNEHSKFRAGTLTFDNNFTTSQPQEIKTRSYATFARLTANLTNALRLVGGARYTHDRKRIDVTSIRLSVSCNPGFSCPTAVLPTAVTRLEDLPFAVPAAGTSIPGPTPNSTITRDRNFLINQTLTKGRVTWRAGIEYDVLPTSLLYATIETGFRSGGFNIAEGFETFRPEFITAITLGSKNRFFDNRIQLNVEAFQWKYRDQQVAHPGVDRSFRANSITENVGKATMRGVEVDARFLLTPSTVLSSTVAYLDAKNKAFNYTVPSPLRPRTNCAVTPIATRPGFFDVNCAGLPSFNAPKWTVNLGAEQTFHLGSYDLVVAADTQYRSKRYLGFDYSPEQLQAGSWTSNAQINFGPSDKAWTIGGFVRNIENDRLLAAPFAFGSILVAYTTPPRTYGIRASAKF